jgi:hypothetical protein
VEESKCVQKPKHHANDHDRVQNRLDAACHGNELVRQPQKDSDNYQHEYHLKKGHALFLSVAA